MDRSALEKKSVGDLREIAGQLGLTGYSSLRKAELVDALLAGAEEAAQDEPEEADDAGSQRRRRADADALIERRRRRGQGAEESDDADQDDDDDDDGDDGDDGDDASGDDASSGDSNDDEGQDDARGRGSRRSRDERRRGRGRDDDAEEREGVLDLLPEGYGFLRTTGYLAGELDVYVSQSYVRRFRLRRGDLLGGPVRFNKGNDRFPALARLETHEGLVVTNENDPKLRDRPVFGDLAAVFPSRRLLADATDPGVQLLDVVAPQGHGQRTVIAAPHGAGASTLLVALAGAAAETGAHVMVVLVDARPEEATWYRRTTSAEVVASELGRPAEDHVALVELAVERARRLAETGSEVVVLVDSMTAVGRAYAAAAAGRGGASGVDPNALAQTKLVFGAGRDLEDAGSITFVGVVVDGPGTEADAALAVELHGAATSRVRLLGIPLGEGLPGFDVAGSGTLREELQVDEATLADLVELRERLVDADADAVAALLED